MTDKTTEVAEEITEAANKTQADQEGTNASNVPPITIPDLILMVRIIDAVSQRGAFHGEELSSVGALRDKLFTVVKAVSPDSIVTREQNQENKAQ